MSKTAIVAPPMESTPPKRARPVTVKVRIGPSDVTPTRSPTAKPWPLAVPTSMTIWSGPAAQEPSVRVSGLKRGWDGSTPKPKLGLSPVMTFPSLPISFALFPVPEKSTRLPVAAATPGSARTLGRSCAGTVGAPLIESATTGLPRTTRSVWVYELLKMVVKARSMVSVRMKLPAIMATPSTTARAVSTARVRRSARLLRATQVIGPPPTAPRAPRPRWSGPGSGRSRRRRGTRCGRRSSPRARRG